MPARLLPLFIAPIILLPIALYAWRRRAVRGASWYAVLLVATAIWGGCYPIELATSDFGLKFDLLRLKYIGVVTIPVAWLGFVLDFTARDGALIRRVTRRMAVFAAAMLAMAWTNQWHRLFWGHLVLQPADGISILVGRGFLFWVNVTYTYIALWTGVGVLIAQAIQSPYLYRKRALIVIVATIIPWAGNVAFMSRQEGPDNLDLTPYTFACTAVLAAIAVFRYRVLDPIPTLRDARIEIIGDGLVIADAKGRIADLNRAAESQLGRNRAELAGNSLLELLPELQALGEQDVRQDVKLPAAAGERTYDLRITPIRGDQAKLTGYVVLLTDVTERRQLEAELRQAQKMEAVGKLAGGVAHDFNNMLTAIIGFATLAEEEAPPGSQNREWLAQIRRSGEHAAAVTRQLLAFGRRQILQPVVLNLNRTVEELQTMLRRLIGEDVLLVTDLAWDLRSVRADVAQIQQVVVNLAVNARDAMPGGGQITIATANVIVDDPKSGNVDLAPGLYVALSVSDTGEGIADEVMGHIFEPFFTTKGVGKGTGLGLSTVYGIVKQSGGDVVAQSSSRGARLTVYLPALPAADTVAIEGEPEGADAPSGGTVLLVEDDNAVREFTAEALRGAGWTVLLASGPADALAIAARETQRIDLLLTDVVMPGMSGGTLADKLAALRPGLRVLFVSGYSEEDVMGRGGLASGRAMLEKPFTPTELRRRIRQLLQPSALP
jgi:two-component system cell cycle sensor histidine kinase/response regulator CckA